MTIIREEEMFRLYVGNVDNGATEEMIGQLLDEQDIAANAIVLKRGYAFVDCLDQKTFDTAINKLNGYNFLGSVLQVEASSISKLMRSTRIQIVNFPPNLLENTIVEFVENFGHVVNCEIVSCETETRVIVTFDTADSARSALEHLQNYDYEGSILQVEYVYSANGGHEAAEVEQTPRHVDLPLRIMVPSDFIGAIIGRKGQAIRSITTTCKVRVDVHGKENTGQVEKMISVFGQCDQCTEACKQIMSIMQKESTNSNRGDVTLKMLIDDRFCGRIIGREGRSIKKVREETGTKITISNIQEMASLYPDRIVAIRGTVENMSRAESAISTKLLECHERDMYNYTRPPGTMLPSSMTRSSATAPGTSIQTRPVYGAMETAGYQPTASTSSYVPPPPPQQQQPPLHPPPLHPPPSPPPPSAAAIARSSSLLSQSSSSSASLRTQQQQQQQQQQPLPAVETCRIGIPNFAVGAIIGAGGANIKRIIRDSNAFVTVEPRREDQNPADERIATIKGNSDACWRASYFIFEKMKLEGFAGSDGEVRLRTTIVIPRWAAGRVIGKGGKNVREIQRITGAMIKLPADISHDITLHQQQEQQQQEQQTTDDEVTVEVFGNFIATQSAHNRIRSMVSKLISPQQLSAPPAPSPLGQQSPSL